MVTPKTKPLEETRALAPTMAKPPKPARGPAGQSPDTQDATNKLDLDSSETRRLFEESMGCNPVVGWLVCTHCPPGTTTKGRDFRLVAGLNVVSRDFGSRHSEIVIADDPMISRSKHAEVEYDPDANAYFLIRQEGAATKVNGNPVRQPIELKSHDLIQLGQHQFIFVPLCTEAFKWQAEP